MGNSQKMFFGGGGGGVQQALKWLCEDIVEEYC